MLRDNSDIMHFFFFEPSYAITWEQVDSDVSLNIAAMQSADNDASFNIYATVQIDSDGSYNIYSTETAIDHDTEFNIQAVSLSDTQYNIFSTLTALDSDTSYNIAAANLTIDHATLYRIRVDDEITN